MKLARLSLFYAAGYLVPAGVLLVAAPRLAFVMLLSSQPDAYGDPIPRMAGAVTLALGVLVVQTIRLRLDALHRTLVAVRVFLVAVWVWLYTRTGDRFFIILAVIVAVGMMLTAAGIVVDRRREALATPP